MRVRSPFNSTHELKKMSYGLLANLHDLESSNKQREKVVSRNGEHGLYLLQFLQKHRELMECIKPQIKDIQAAKAIDQYLNKLDYLARRIDANSKSRRALRKGAVASFLTAHTRTFNLLKSKRIALRSGNCTGIWDNEVLAAIAVWDHNVR